jgi:hypothetical protein
VVLVYMVKFSKSYPDRVSHESDAAPRHESPAR